MSPSQLRTRPVEAVVAPGVRVVCLRLHESSVSNVLVAY